MGVSGAYKITVGERLGERLNWKFAEGHRLHSLENVAEMQSGHPLTNAERARSACRVATDQRVDRIVGHIAAALHATGDDI